jgi:hypothetical protein
MEGLLPDGERPFFFLSWGEGKTCSREAASSERILRVKLDANGFC